MLADYLPGTQPDWAWCHRARSKRLHESAVVPVGHETQVLALNLGCHWQSKSGCQLPDLGLRIAAYRKHRVGQLNLGKNTQHVALILARVCALAKLEFPTGPDVDARVMPGRQVGRAPRHRLIQQIGKSNVPVAGQTRIGRNAVRIALDEAIDHLPLEDISRVDHVERNTKFPRDEMGINHLVSCAAAIVPAARYLT